MTVKLTVAAAGFRIPTIAVAQGGTAPALGTLLDGDAIASALSAGAVSLDNYTSAGGAIVKVEARAVVNGADVGVIDSVVL